MSAILEYKVKDTDKFKTVGILFKSRFNFSSGLLKELKMSGKLFLNGVPCRSVDTVKVGDVVKADVSEDMDVSEKYAPYDVPLDILFEDDFLIVINKPGGMDSQPCPTNRTTTLANALMNYWRQNGEYHNYHIVNRLDKETSGICVIAKNRFAHGVLSKQMKAEAVRKEYCAIVHGVPNPQKGEIDLPIRRKENSVLMREVHLSGKPSKTCYEVIKTLKNGEYSLCDITLITGRTHQIRVHFSTLGHPLLGDWLYGNGENERGIISGQALHAKYLSFRHPANGKEVEFEAEMPLEMKKFLNLH